MSPISGTASLMARRARLVRLSRFYQFARIGAAEVVRRVGEEGEGGMARGMRVARCFDRKIDAEAADAGHGLDGGGLVLPIDDEERPDEIGGREHGFAHEVAHPAVRRSALLPAAVEEIHVVFGQSLMGRVFIRG